MLEFIEKPAKLNQFLENFRRMSTPIESAAWSPFTFVMDDIEICIVHEEVSPLIVDMLNRTAVCLPVDDPLCPQFLELIGKPDDLDRLRTHCTCFQRGFFWNEAAGVATSRRFPPIYIKKIGGRHYFRCVPPAKGKEAGLIFDDSGKWWERVNS